MSIGSYSKGSLSQSTYPTRVAFEATFTPASTGAYEIDVYNYRSLAQTDCWNYVDNISAAPADFDFKKLQDGISGSLGGSMYLQIIMGWQYSGEPYLVLFSQGIDTGFALDGFHIALNYDYIFQYSQSNINKGPFDDTFGTLDGMGRVSAKLTLGANPLNIGKCFYAQACLLTPPGTRPVTHVTNPVLFEILP